MRYSVPVVTILLALLMGCSGGGPAQPPIVPDNTPAVESGDSARCLWGLWQFRADPDAGTLEYVPLRAAGMHVNVLPFLEPPAGLKLAVSGVVFDGMICDCDVSLTHPFPGLDQFIGFDVCGIMIGSGTDTGYHEPFINMAGEGDTRVLNADGYSRWWNPVEFPNNGTMFGYIDGLLGKPDSIANYNCTLNGYKLFSDNLDPHDDITDLDPEDRVVFPSGLKLTRHYTIDFAGGVEFNYAVDASWEHPPGDPPYDVDDYEIAANRPEAWAITVTEVENTLWNDGSDSGGTLTLSIHARDHFVEPGDDVNLWIDSPGNFIPHTFPPVGFGPGYAAFEAVVPSGEATPKAGSIDILIGVQSDAVGYGGILDGETVTAYFRHTSEVGGTTPEIEVLVPNGGETWEGLTDEDITWWAPASVENVDISYSKDDFASDINSIAQDYPNSGTYTWFVENDPSETVKVRVSESGGGLSDDSDDYFTILEASCDFGSTGFGFVQGYDNPPVWSHTGILATKQDPVQRIIGHSWSSEGLGGIIKIFNASNPLAGAVATYDTGDLIYCNNDQAMWLDSFSESGIDRIAYNNFGSGSPTPDYQLKVIDWDGTDFIDPQTLPKSGSIWSLCFTPDGDIILHNAQSVAPSFYFYDKSDNYNYTFLFQLQQTTCDFGSVGNIRQMVYDPVMDCVLLFCRNTAVSDGGQLFAIDMDGELVEEDLDVLETSSLIRFRIGIDIDLDDPDCRIVCYAGTDDGIAHFARYSAEMDEKEIYQISNFAYGLCRGDFEEDGTLWASPDTGISRFYKFDPPPDW